MVAATDEKACRPQQGRCRADLARFWAPSSLGAYTLRTLCRVWLGIRPSCSTPPAHAAHQSHRTTAAQRLCGSEYVFETCKFRAEGLVLGRSFKS